MIQLHDSIFYYVEIDLSSFSWNLRMHSKSKLESTRLVNGKYLWPHVHLIFLLLLFQTLCSKQPCHLFFNMLLRHFIHLILLVDVLHIFRWCSGVNYVLTHSHEEPEICFWVFTKSFVHSKFYINKVDLSWTLSTLFCHSGTLYLMLFPIIILCL